jgi:hypothetical protein
MAAAIAVVGVFAAASWDENATPAQQARATAPTSTTAPSKVLAIVLDNTTTTDVAPAVVTTTTAVSTTAVRTGKIWGYSYPSSSNDTTTVGLSRNGTTVAERQTDAEGLFAFADLPPGTYLLTRTSRSSNCPTTTTTSGPPTCTMASSLAQGPEVSLAAGHDSRVDFF